MNCSVWLKNTSAKQDEMKDHVRRRRGRAFTALLAGALAACGDTPATDPPAIAVDTLPDGSILVNNPAEGVWDRHPQRRWRLVETVRIGRRDGGGPEAFGQVGAVVEDALGRMWVVDAQANEVRVFDRGGAFVRSVGREGEGPGEFKRIGPAFPGPDGQIWIEDIELARFEVFDTAGTRIAGHRSTIRLRGGWRHWTADGRFLAADVETRPDGEDHPFIKIHRLYDDGALEVVGTAVPPIMPEPDPSQVVAFEYPDGGGIEQLLPFAPMTDLANGRDGDWWLLCASCGHRSYDLVRMNGDGDTLLTIRRRYDPVVIPEDVRRDALSSLERYEDGATKVTPRLSLDLIPGEYPPFGGFMAGSDGVLWLQAAIADGRTGFDVFSADGRYLGQPDIRTSLDGMRFHTITTNSIYAVAYGELGINQVVRLDIDREPVRDGTATGVSAPGGPQGDGVVSDVGEAEGAAEAPEPESVPTPPEGAFQDCAVCPWMNEVPAGSFLMGSPESEEGRYENEGPRHRVEVAAFAAGVYEVTFDEWEACVEAGGCSYTPPEMGPRGITPVMWVEWEHTREYAAWLSRETGEEYRLLTEAEWEYAARGGTTSARYWGESDRDQCRHANGYDKTGHDTIGNLYRQPVACDDGHGRRAPVGSYLPNAFGLYDMLGNVMEWTQDCGNGSYEGAPGDGSAWESGRCDYRVVRGGNYLDESRRLRSSVRGMLNITNNGIGFRVARDLR